MRVDLRVKHDVEARKAAIGLFELGHGYKSAAIALFASRGSREKMAGDIPRVRERGAAAHGRKAGQVTYEQKVAAASAVVDGGMTKTEAMAAFGIMSMSPLKKWCALYREGGAGGPAPEAQGPAERFQGEAADPRGGARGAVP